MALCTRVGQPSFSSASCNASALMIVRQHAHVIAGGALDAAFAAGQAAENVPAADDNHHLHAQFAHLADLLGHVLHRLGTDAHAAFASERLAAQLDQHTGKFGRFGRCHAGDCGARNIGSFLTAGRREVKSKPQSDGLTCLPLARMARLKPQPNHPRRRPVLAIENGKPRTRTRRRTIGKNLRWRAKLSEIVIQGLQSLDNETRRSTICIAGVRR